MKLIAPSEADRLAALFIQAGGGRLQQAILSAALEATLVFEERANGAANGRFLASFYAWTGLMVRAGILHRDPRWMPLWDPADPYDSYYPHYGRGAGPARLPPLLSYHVPMPPWECRRSKHERLIDQLLWALSSSKRWPGLKAARPTACVCLAACLVRAQQDGSWMWRMHPMERRRDLLQSAVAWLFSELPAALPANSQASSALDDFAEIETGK